MITFPPEFVATRYPGYFWNTKTQQLFSIKVTGELRPIRFNKANHFNKWEAGYRVSVAGRRHYLRQSYLMKLTPNKNSVVPVRLPE